MTLRNIFWHYSTQFGFILHYSWQFFTKHKYQNRHSIPWSKKYVWYAIYEEIRPVQLNWNVRKIIQTDSSFQGLGQYEKSERKKNLYTLLQNFWSCAIISQDGLLPTASQCKSPLAPHGAAVGSGTTVAHRADRRQKHLASIKREVQLRYAHTIPGIY